MNLSYRQYRPGDETAIAELYREVFAIPYEKEKWLWQYKRNPDGARNEVLLAFDGAKLIGHIGAVPTTLASTSGPLRASHSQDGFVRREYRGARVFTRLLEELDEVQRRHAVALDIGHPNHQSFPAMTGLGGWDHLFDTYPFVLDLGSLGDPEPGDGSATIDLTDSVSFSDADARFLERELASYGIRGRRDRAWLEWRFHPDSGKRYRVARAYEGGELVGLAVAKPYPPGNAVDLVELVCPDDGERLRAVLRATGASYRAEGLETLALWSMEHYRLHPRLLELGFRRQDRKTHFIARAVAAPAELRWREPTQYYLSMGDSDVY